MSEITFDWKPGIEEVCLKLKGKKRIGIQIPDGLKTKSHEIVTLVTKLTEAKVVLWGEATYGACDLADRPLEEIGADALVHMGHLPMPYHSEFHGTYCHAAPRAVQISNNRQTSSECTCRSTQTARHFAPPNQARGARHRHELLAIRLVRPKSKPRRCRQTYLII